MHLHKFMLVLNKQGKGMIKSLYRITFTPSPPLSLGMRILSEFLMSFLLNLVNEGGNRNSRSKITIRFTPSPNCHIKVVNHHMINHSYPFLKSVPYPYYKRITATGVFCEPRLRPYIDSYRLLFLLYLFPGVGTFWDEKGSVNVFLKSKSRDIPVIENTSSLRIY